MKTLFKFIIGVPVIGAFLVGIIFFIIGVYDTFLGIRALLSGQLHTDANPDLMLFESIDYFLVGFLFLILSIGFLQLFFPRPSKIVTAVQTITPEWLKVENFTQLKLILWDTVLTTLVIMFFAEAYKNQGEYEWKLMLLPITILIITFSKYLMKATKK